MTLLDPDEMPAVLATMWPRTGRVEAGINDDDCAVLELEGKYLVVTTDFLNDDPIALQLGVGTHRDVGRLLVAASMADLLSTGARPEGLLIGAMFPRGSSEESFFDFIAGVREEAAHCEVQVIGGDTKLGQRLSLYGIAIGSVSSRRCLMLKNGGRPGDVLFVSGNLGSCNAAVLGLTQRMGDARLKQWFVEAITKPQLPLESALRLQTTGVAHSGADISDGLGADLEKLCRASEVGAVVRAADIPISGNARVVADLVGVPPWALSFGGGGDFQLLVSGPHQCAPAILNCGFKAIGYLTQDRELRLELEDGEVRELPILGHRDARGASFSAEIEALVRRAVGGV